MNSFRPVIILSALLSLQAQGQYAIHSPYLREPERMLGYVDSCAAFWSKTGDPVKGGYYTNIDRSGKVITSWGKNKNMITQSRHAYGFVRAFMLTGNEAYLTAARKALDFMYAHAWDKTHGGWYNELDESGNPQAAASPKTAFYQHYALLGPSTFVEATRDTLDQRWLEKALAFNENKLWDPDPIEYGYYDQIDYNGANARNKSFNATVDAITTHILALYLMTGDETWRLRLSLLTDNMIVYLYRSMPFQKIGFIEHFDSHWLPDSSQTMTIMGHVLKTAWCLGRIYQFDPQPYILEAAESLTQHVLQNGYDHTYGGPYKDYNRVTGEMLMWGKADTAKAWWQMEQAVTAGMMLYDITHKAEYLEMADETLDFFMRHFVDHSYGEVYENRTRYGGLIWGDQKGNSGKAGYHSIELGYYVYLYGSLFVHNRPVQLHYRFAPAAQPRTLELLPLAIPTKRLLISRITLEGQPYSQFDPVNRSLSLPAGTGGHFVVTFTTQPETGIAEQPAAAGARLELLGSYPNPFNASTQLSLHLERTEHVSIIIYDIRGREMATLHDGLLESGTRRFTWDAEGLPSGVYLYTVRSQDSFVHGKLTHIR